MRQFSDSFKTQLNNLYSGQKNEGAKSTSKQMDLVNKITQAKKDTAKALTQMPKSTSNEPKQEIGFWDRVGSAVSGAAKQYGGSVAATGAWAHELGTQPDTTLKDDYQTKYNRAKYAYDMMVSENTAKPGTWSQSDLDSTMNVMKDAKSKLASFKPVQNTAKAEEIKNRLWATAARLTESGSLDIAQAKQGLGTMGKFAVDVGVGLGQLGADIGIGLATGGAAIPMAARSFGGGALEARSEGATLGQQGAYGALSAATELLTEKIASVGKINTKAFGAGAMDDILDGVVSRVEDLGKTDAGRAMLNRIASAGTGFISEGAEEAISAVVNPFLQKATYSKEPIDLKALGSEVANSFFVGGAIGAITGGVGGTDTTKVKANIAESKQSVNTPAAATSQAVVVEATQSKADTQTVEKAVQQAQNADYGKPAETKTATVLDTGTTAYVQLGMKPKRAEAKAKVVQKLINGEEVSLDGMKSLNLTDAKYRDVFTQLTGVVFPEGVTNHDQLMNVAKTASEVRKNVAAEPVAVEAPSENVSQVPETPSENVRGIHQDIAQVSGAVVGTPLLTAPLPDVANYEQFAEAYRQSRNVEAGDAEVAAEFSKYLNKVEQARDMESVQYRGRSVSRKQFREMFRKQNSDTGVSDAQLNEVFDRELSRQTVARMDAAPDQRKDLSAEAQKTIGAFEEKLGITVKVQDRVGGPRGKSIRGKFDPETRTLYIAKNARGDLSHGDVAMQILRHELTHYLKTTSPEAYSKYVGFVRENVSDYQDAFDAKVKAYKGIIDQNDTSAIEEELAAEYAEKLFNDEEFVRLMVKQDRSLAEKIYEAIKALFGKLTGEGFNSVRTELTEAQKLWTDMLEPEKTKNTAQKDGEVRYDLKNVNGKSIVWIEHSDLTSKQLSNHDAVAAYIAQHIGEVYTIIESGQRVYIGDDLPSEYAHSKYTDSLRKRNPGALRAKNRAANELGLLIETATNRRWEKTKHAHNKDAKYGVYRYDSTFAFPVKSNQGNTTGVKAFDVELVIRNASDGKKYLYDIVNLKENTADAIDLQQRETRLATYKAASQGSASKLSVAQDDATVKVGVSYDEKTESVSPVMFSLDTWNESDYVTARADAAKAMSEALGITQKKAKAYIDSVNSIAKMIANDRVRLDYEASPGRSSFVSNSEYGGSIDFSTICKKRRLFTGTFEAIQKALPNTALTAEEFLEIRSMMDEKGYEVSCGLCYVEGSRANMGQYAKQFLEQYEQTSPEYLPNMAEINTPDGLERIRAEHPEVYAAYEKFMNGLAQRKPKLYQTATAYQGEVLNKFGRKGGKVEEKNYNGGLRLQSFSDFEIIHLIDCMQVIMDMSRVGLAGQAYTKVPDFAWALGDTGLKINLSLISKGVDSDGKIILDEKEGMSAENAFALRDRYSENVGTVLVVFSDEQLKAALADERIDYVLPFHRSQWRKDQYDTMGLPADAKDYTPWQNESYIKPVLSKSGKKQRPDNFMPNTYWDFSKSGKENAETYLRMCAEGNRKPKFSHLLVNNKDGSYSLQPDGSTDGYWKLLIDFKMYDNNGKGVPQRPVRPDFNMEQANRMLEEYKGGHSRFPAADDVVSEFVEQYKRNHPGVRYSVEETDSDGNKLSKQQIEFFKDSKVRDEQGRLIPVYHGTEHTGFTEFSETDDYGYFFTNSLSLAHTYSGGEEFAPIKVESWDEAIQLAESLGFTLKRDDDGNYVFFDGWAPSLWPEDELREFIDALNDYEESADRGVYATYLNLKDPLIIEGNGANWDSITNSEFQDSIEAVAKDGNLEVVVRDRGTGDERLRQTFTDFEDVRDAFISLYGGEEDAVTDIMDRLQSEIDEDMQYGNYDDDTIDVDYGGYWGYGRSTREWVREAMDMGCDGVIFRNLNDEGKFGRGYSLESDVYVALSANQIKSIKNETPTDDPDIRYAVDSADDFDAAVQAAFEAAYQESLKNPPAAPASQADNEMLGWVIYNQSVGAAALRFDPYTYLLNEYGAIEQTGKNNHRVADVPKSTDGKDKVSKTTTTVTGAKATPEARLTTIAQAVVDGELSYEPIANKITERKIRNKLTKDGWDDTLASWTKAVHEGKSGADLVAMGATLLNNAGNSGMDGKAYIRLMTDYAQLLRNAGQSLQAANIFKKMSPEGKLYGIQKQIEEMNADELTKKLTGQSDIVMSDALAQRYLAAQTDEERDILMEMILQDIANQVPATFMDKFKAWRYTAMLGNFRTMIRNVSGNALMQPVRSTKTVFAALGESLMQKAGVIDERTTGLTRDKETLKAAAEDFQNVKDIIAGGGRYRDDNSKTDLSAEIRKRQRVFKNALLEGYRKTTQWAMDNEWFGDEAFSRIAYRDALARYIAANDLTWSQASEELKDRARVVAIREAAESTYRDNNDFSDLVTSIRFRNPDTSAKKFANAMLEGILPFKKTPANILVRSIEYSPIGFANAVRHTLAKNPDRAVTDIINEYAKGLTGTSILALGMGLAALGMIRGKAPDEEKEKELWEMQGHQEYSLEIGGTSYTIDWAAPLSIPLLVGAELFEALQSEGLTVREMSSVASSVFDPLLEMSMLQGINDAISNAQTWGDESALVRFTGNALWSYVSQVVPTLLGQLERSSVNERTTTYADKNKDVPDAVQRALGKVSAKIPGWDHAQTVYIDAWGRTQANAANRGLNVLEQFFSPGYGNAVVESAMETELLRLKKATGESGVLITSAPKYFTVDNARKDLTADEYLVYAVTRGQTAYSLLTRMTGSGAYMALTDEQKVDAVVRAYDYANQIAKEQVTGGKSKVDNWVSEARTNATQLGLDVSTYLTAYAAMKDWTGLKDKEGNTVDNSLSYRKAVEIQKIPDLTNEQQVALAKSLGCSSTVTGFMERNPKIIPSKWEGLKKKYG